MTNLYRQTCINGHPATSTPDNGKPWRCGNPECEFFEGADDTAYGEDTDSGQYRAISREEFREGLTALINECSMEYESNTPDYIISDYLMGCLDAFNSAAQARAKWYGEGKS